MARPPGLSVRVKLTLSYAGFLTIAGVLLIAVVWLFLLRERSSLYLPTPRDFLLVLNPRNFGPRIFSPAAIATLALLLVVGLVGGWFLAGRMLAPLTRITNATRKAASGSLSYRIELEGRNDEFRELADAFDAMLAQLEARVAEQQRFAANASHELRTPLAITQTLLDVARNEPNHPDDRLIERLRVINTRAIALTEALLLLSRADQRSFVPEPVDLTLLAEEAAETLLPLAEERDITITTAGEAAPVLGSPALLQQLVTNLLHNAIVHNLPDHGTAHLTTAGRLDQVVLTVENTGSRLSPGLVATLTEPFQRGTERVRSDQAGAGLGLAIVKSIVRAHDGMLQLAALPEGGLRVTVQLPAVPTAVASTAGPVTGGLSIADR
ncbi:MAG: HAMP domain-containing sensor histidine kinase [Microlunatus sp.]